MTTTPTPVRTPPTPPVQQDRRPLAAMVFVALIAAGILLVIALEGGLVRGSTAGPEQIRTVAAFTAVQLDASDDVTVHVGGAPNVVVRGDANRLDRVTTDVEDGTLVVGRRGFFGRGTSFQIEITVPTLDAIALHGSGRVGVDGLDEPSLTVALPGSGMITASGTVERLQVNLSGSGEVQLQDLEARNATASVAGSGHIFVHATQTLDAAVSGSGTISYTGDPTVTRNITGSGAIEQQ